MKRLLLTIACWLTFAVAPGETQRSFHADIPPIVGNETPLNDSGQPFGWVGMAGSQLPATSFLPCGWEVQR